MHVSVPFEFSAFAVNSLVYTCTYIKTIIAMCDVYPRVTTACLLKPLKKDCLQPCGWFTCSLVVVRKIKQVISVRLLITSTGTVCG